MGLDKIKLPVAENLVKKVLALPHHQGLNEEDIKFVCREVNKFYKNF